MAEQVRRVEGSGRNLADGPLDATGASVVAGPERPFLVDRVLGTVVAVVVAAVVVALVVACVLASDPAFGLFLGLMGAVVAVRPARRAWALNRGAGSFVLVVDHQVVRGTSRRWQWPFTFTAFRTGHWVHLVDATTQRSLGWVELAPRSATRLTALGAAALFGSLSHRGAAVLVDPDRNAQVVGCAVVDLPAPFYREKLRGRI